jgi:hypothetical protein
MMPGCPGAIANLSVALFREWRPERLFVIFTAYLDESGTHGGSPITLMSAFLGSARQWQNFEKDYVKLRRIYGFSVFHAKDWRDTDGEFEGWSRQKKNQFVWDFFKIIDERLAAGVSAFLKNDEYSKYYSGCDRPHRARWDTKYAICFRAVLSMLLAEMDKRARPDKVNTLHLVLERGAKNAGDAILIFNWIKDNIWPEDADLLGTMTFDGKRECPALATADLLAYSTNYFEVDSLKPPEKRRLGTETDELKSDIWRIAIGPKELSGLRDQVFLTHHVKRQRIILKKPSSNEQGS